MNRCKTPAAIPHGSTDAHTITVNTRDTERFFWLFNASPSSSRRLSASSVSDQQVGDANTSGHNPAISTEGSRLDDAKYGLLGKHWKWELATLPD